VPTARRTWDVKRRGRQWVVKRLDGQAADSIHDDHDDAIRRAAEICRRTGGTLRSKAQTGRVEAEIVFAGAERTSRTSLGPRA
jgi:tRNA A37 N6-isopentenylltransferase MiaA